MVKPKPLAPRRIMIGGFRELMRGETSLQGEATRLLAVELPSRLCTAWGWGWRR